MSLLEIGTSAPDFTLSSAPDQRLSLSNFRGKNVVLVFYPADWSPVCSDQIGIYNEILSMFNQFNAQLLGISVDSVWCHAAWQQQRKLKFPLLADFEPKGDVSRKYGVYNPYEGTSERALYVIDSAGLIQWGFISPIDENPGADGILDALEALQTKEAHA